jgi:hypothetical protein
MYDPHPEQPHPISSEDAGEIISSDEENDFTYCGAD